MASNVDSEHEEEITTFENYHIDKGILVFDDFDSYNIAYHNLENFLLQLNQNNYRSQDDFKSLKSIYDDIHNEIWEFQEDQEDEIYEFINQNSKYVSLVQSEDSAQELINTTDTRQDKFANQDFVFMIDGVLYDVRDIENLYENSQTISRMDCGQEIEVTVTNDNNRCKNDRRGTIRVRAVRDNITGPGARDCFAEIQVRLKGQRKRVCIWVNYSTVLSFIGTPTVSAMFPGASTAPSTPVIVTGPGWTGSMSCSNCSDIELLAPPTSFATVGCTGDYFLTRVGVTGTTQGLNGANINAVCF